MKERRKEGRLGRVSDFSAISNKVSQWGILEPKSPGTVLPDAQPLATSSPVLQGKEGSQPRSKGSGRCRGSVSQLCLHSGRFGWHIYMVTTGVTQPKSPESALLQTWLYLGVQMTTPQYFFTSWSCFLSMSSIFQQVLSMWWSNHHERFQAHLFSVSTPARKNLPVSFLRKCPRNNSSDWL